MENSSIDASAHKILVAIRRCKTYSQIHSVFGRLYDYVSQQKEKNNADLSRRKSKSNLSLLDKGGLLSACSVLCAAYSRHLGFILEERSNQTAFEEHETSSLASTLAAEAEEQIWRLEALLKSFHFAQVRTGGPEEKSIIFRPSDRILLCYGVGEIYKFRAQQHQRGLQKLQVLLNELHWDVKRIADCIVALSGSGDRNSISFSAYRAQQRGHAGVETTIVVTPLRDVFSQAVIRVPVRGSKCTHLEVFDLLHFVLAVQQRSASGHGGTGAPCPLCRSFILLSDVYVDAAAQRAMAEYSTGDKDAQQDGAILTADHALQWNIMEETVKVVEGKRRREEGENVEADKYEKILAEAPLEKLTVQKKRRVEIGGHVLYTDE